MVGERELEMSRWRLLCLHSTETRRTGHQTRLDKRLVQWFANNRFRILLGVPVAFYVSRPAMQNRFAGRASSVLRHNSQTYYSYVLLPAEDRLRNLKQRYTRRDSHPVMGFCQLC